MLAGDILELNERSFGKRYGRSLREAWRQLLNSGEITEDILQFYDNCFELDRSSEGGGSNTEQESTLLLFLCGIGDPLYLRNAINRMPCVSRIVVYEPDDTAFLYLCTKSDISDIISDDRTDIVIYEEGAENKIINLIDKSIAAENVAHIKMRLAPGFESIYTEIYSFLYRHIQKRTDEINMQINMYKAYGSEPCKNELYAVSVLDENCLSGDLFRSIPDREIPVILVGAGPSLEKNVDILKDAKGRSIIVAASHALKTCIRAGVEPDLVAEIEPAMDLGFLDHDTERKYRLLVTAKCARSSQLQYKGKCIYYGFEKDFLPFFAGSSDDDYVINGGSVMTDMFDLFVKEGFRSFILVGQDLAYGEGGVTHTDAETQASDSKSGMIQVEGINGEPVYSRPDWVRFRNYLETRISRFPEAVVIDATEGGALIHGTMLMCLHEAIDRTCIRSYPVKEWIDSVPPAMTQSQYNTVMTAMQNTIGNLHLCESCLDEVAGLGKEIIGCIKGRNNKGERFLSLCNRYDRLYHTILDADAAKWLIYYAEGELQDYIREKWLYENTGDIVKKVESELRMFEILKKLTPELTEYMEDIFADKAAPFISEIMECNEKSFYERYGRSLKEMWAAVQDTGEADEGILEYYANCYGISREEAANVYAAGTSGALLWFFCGIGDGYYVKKVIENIRDTVRIIIYEPDNVSFLYACTLSDISGLINDPRVELVIYDEEKSDRISDIFDEAIQLYNAEHISSVLMPGYENLYQEIYDALREQMKQKAEAIVSTAKTALRVSEEPCRNELYALSVLRENSMIGALVERIDDRNMPIIIVGAGPSLDRNKHALAKAKGKAMIIAASHAVKRLNKAGIKPDIVASIDPVSDRSFLKDETEDKLYLLANVQAARHDMIDNNGRCIFYGFDREQFPFECTEGQKELSGGGGSVSTEILDIFEAYGFSRFILAGLDLAYDEEGYSHAGGEVRIDKTQTDRIPVRGINGNEVISRPDWIQFKRYIENRLMSDKQLKIIDATEGGALIEGTRIMTLEAAIKETCDKVYPIEEWLRDLPKAQTEEEADGMCREMAGYVHNLDECADRIRSAIDINHSIMKCMEKKAFGSEYNKLCRRYDELYQKIMNSQAGGLLAYFGQDIVQDYLRNALVCEQSGDVLRKMSIEENMFTGLLPKIGPLKTYILDLFGDEKGDADK